MSLYVVQECFRDNQLQAEILDLDLDGVVIVGVLTKYSEQLLNEVEAIPDMIELLETVMATCVCPASLIKEIQNTICKVKGDLK